ncbi:hypothetical protein V5799_018380 [Amblyomma americanum]|uniref:Fatty acyl-CoA reductase n=1 Tax=Amblyomma americanum TaxID=6943 RepID=A0AAQ4EZW7_AMBAM
MRQTQGNYGKVFSSARDSAREPTYTQCRSQYSMGSPGFEQRQPSPPTSFFPDGNGDSQVARFYQDRTVFLTGGTGFIGKVLLEKLLRSCPGLKQVYLLIRTKRGEEPQARLTTMLSSKVFESLKQDRPGALDKVRAVSGDITLPSLGLSMSDRATLVEEVSVVFHSAATINFNEPLKSEHVRVYHCTSGAFKCQTWGDMTTAVQEAVLRYPMPYVARYPKMAVTSSELWYSANLWCLHCLPAFVGDLALQMMGQQPRFVQRYQKVSKRIDLVSYFTTHGWQFRSNNVVGLISDLSSADKKLFSIDVQNIELGPYWEQNVRGIRKYLFKAEDDELLDARRQMKRCSPRHHVQLCLVEKRAVGQFSFNRSADENATDTPDGLLRGLPNTYTFTKRLAESLVLDERGAIPVAIVRPSIVTASWREPFPGWIDNFAACTGAAASLGLGLLPSIMANKDCIADIIPVDIVANMLICVAWRTANTRPEHVAVYHCTSGDLKRQTWGDLTAALQRSILRHPLPYMVRYPDFAVTSNHMWHNVLWYLHYLPVYVGGVALQLIGRKPRLAPRLEKVRERTAILQYFLTHGWLFKWNNVVGLIEDLSRTDKKLFSLDIQDIEWEPYCDQYVLGIRKYLLKAEDDKLPDSRRRLKRLYAVHLSSRFLLLILASRLLMTDTAWELGHSTKTVATGLYETLLSLWSP